jgi:hypothetical protein
MSRTFDITFKAFDEPWPGEKWLASHQENFGKWADWLAANSSYPRASADECRRAVATHMPEWLPVYEPITGTARYIWPDGNWEQSICDFKEGERSQRFTDQANNG